MCKYCEGNGTMQAKRRGTAYTYGFRCDCEAAERRGISTAMAKWSSAMDRNFCRDTIMGIVPEKHQPQIDYKLARAADDTTKHIDRVLDL